VYGQQGSPGAAAPPVEFHQAIAAGFVGCAASEIAVTNLQRAESFGAADVETWSASCRGRLFFCSRDITMSDHCAESVPPAVAPPPPAAVTNGGEAPAPAAVVR